jgi:hypothetical protein
MSDPLHRELDIAANAIKDDIRGVFKACPIYGDYLAKLLRDAAAALRAYGQREQKVGDEK